MTPSRYAKAINAAITAALGLTSTILIAGSPSWEQWLAVATTAWAVGYFTYWTPNSEAPIVNNGS
jgi:hypothetical protein